MGSDHTTSSRQEWQKKRCGDTGVATAHGFRSSLGIGPATRNRNKLLGQMRRILAECQPSASYAATAATVLHSDDAYSKVRKIMEDNALWNKEFEGMHETSLSISL